MPEISRFLGIVIKMFHNDHLPPHLHAYYQNYNATFSLKTGQMIEGLFPPKQSSFITAWILLHEKELMANWNSLLAGKNAKKEKTLR